MERAEENAPQPTNEDHWDKKARPPLRLIPDSACHDTVKSLEKLLAMAREGKIVGFCAVPVFKDRTYNFHVTGECKRNTTLASAVSGAMWMSIGASLIAEV